jgi:Ni/Co efflux regulator RcnB
MLLAAVALMAFAPASSALADPGRHGGPGHADGRKFHGEGHGRHDHKARRGHGHDKWRGRPEWRAYAGPRAGYWYAPGYGYRPVSRDVVWRRGAYLPARYRTYYVQEPAFYRLAPAPRGHRWVYGADSFVLIAVSTGLITSVVAMSDGPPAWEPRREAAEVRVERRPEPVVISRNDEVWRDTDGRYRCRRADGTVGLVIGGAVGALVGRELDGGRDRTAGTILGAAGGALLGRELERSGARCE